jgi:uncharacterized membrane protein YgaE (UPF0421/DUF939 family)
MTFHDIAKRTSLITATQMTLAVSSSYLIAIQIAVWLHFNSILISGLWAGISSIMVMQAQIEDTHHAGGIRFLGTVFGGICSTVITMISGYTVVSIICPLFFTTTLVSLLNLNAMIRISNLTALVIIVYGMIDPTSPPWVNTLARIFESAVGISTTIIMVWVFYPIRKKFDLSENY